MSFNKENKITYNELAPSLQAMIDNKADKDEFTLVKNKFDTLVALSGGVRITITTSLTSIKSPTNDKEIAIVTTDSVVTMYTYHNNAWVKIHAVYAWGDYYGWLYNG